MKASMKRTLYLCPSALNRWLWMKALGVTQNG